MAYLRFVCLHPVKGMMARAGFLAAAYKARDSADIDPTTAQALNSQIEWFRANLAVPERFGRTSSKGWYRRDSKGLSWFKPGASDHIARAFELAATLERAGVMIEVIRSDRIGYVIYEDDHQVVAEPFADTPV